MIDNGEDNVTEQTNHIIIPSYAAWFDYNRYCLFFFYMDTHNKYIYENVCMCVYYSPFVSSGNWRFMSVFPSLQHSRHRTPRSS